MHIIDILLLVIKSEDGGELRGRTLLQKKIYFLSILMDVDLGFAPHYYGPYSSFVASHLDGLVNYGVLKETTEPLPTASVERTPWGEIRKHTYIYSVIPEVADKVWDATEKKPGFSEWDQKLKAINSEKIAGDSNKLSVAAKVYYIVNSDGEKSVERIHQKAGEYGWNVNIDHIKSGLSFLKKLGL